MRRIFAGLLVFVFAFSAHANSDGLKDYINKLTADPQFENASWSVKVVKIKDSKTVAEYNSQQSLIPASIEKLLTTGISIHVLGSDFRFKTCLMYDGQIQDSVLQGNLYIVGGGDPFLGSYRYKQTCPDSVFFVWYSALRQKGISAIEGNIYFDASIFDEEPIPGSWQWEDMGNYYGCGASGLSFHENMYYICFKPSLTEGGAAKILYTKPSINSLAFDNKVTTGPAKSGDNVVIYACPESNTHLLRGTVPLDDPEFLVRGAMPNPAKTCAEFFVKYLQQKKIKISKPVQKMPDFASMRSRRSMLFEYYSYPLSQIITQTNLQSNNMYAECLFKYLGYAEKKVGSYKTGQDAIYSFLKLKSLNSKGLNIEDGSGLSRQNLLTTSFLCSFMQWMKEQDTDDVFYNSLTKASQSANINQQLAGTNGQNTLRYKTGSMKNVRSYAGYMQNSKGEWVCFSIIANNFNAPDTEIRAKLEKLFYHIAKSE